MMRILTILIAVILSSCLYLPQARAEDAGLSAARAFFKQWEQLGNSYDARLVHLYSDKAIVQNTRQYPAGQKKTMRLSGAQYKQLLKMSMPIAKKRGDKDRYSGVTYTKEKNGYVRIKATRHSLLKNYKSPVELVVAPNSQGRWKIVQELSYSIPTNTSSKTMQIKP